MPTSREALFTTYLWAVILTGAAIVAVGLLHAAENFFFFGRPDLVVVFFVLVLVADVKPISWLRRRESAQFTANLSYQAALLFVAAGAMPAVLAGLGSLIGDMALRRTPLKAVFNAAMTTISVAVAGVLIDLVSTRDVLLSGRSVDGSFMLAAIIGLGALYLCNGLVVLTVVALNEGTSWRDAIRRDLFHSFDTDGVLLALGPVMVVVAARSLLLLPALLLLSVVVFRSARMALERLHDSTHDALTGLPNRRMFREQLGGALKVRHRGTVTAVGIIDLDGFKEVNDRLGHDVGDEVLVAAAERLRAGIGEKGMVARLGGDEFAVLLPRMPSREQAEARFHQVHDQLVGPLEVGGFPVTVGGSIGVAFAEDHRHAPDVLRQADLAMYTVKSEGGGVLVAPSSGAEVASTGRLGLLADLERATSSGEMAVHYQPIVPMDGHGPIELEALIRWRHPEVGMVPPSDFIPLAEQTDLIRPLTDMVVERAVGDLARWRDAGHDVSVAVNLSARSLQDLRWSRRVLGLLERAGIAGDLLTFEVTENAVLADPARTERVLSDLRAIGVRFAIDDFGTGHSSLVSLRDLPVDVLKIDGRFVGSMCANASDEAIVAACLGLAHQLGLRAVAEGVEDGATMDALRRHGCRTVQGYHIARPMPADEVLPWLTAHTSTIAQDIAA